MAFFNAVPLSFRSKIITFIKFVFFRWFADYLAFNTEPTLAEKRSYHSFRIANYNWVFLAIILGILSHVLRSLRWMIFFEPMGYHPSFKNTFYAVMVGYFANMAFPKAW